MLIAEVLLLELHLRCQLDRTRPADLVQRIEAAALSPTAQRIGQHLRWLAKLRRAEKVDRAAEIGMIKDVEEVGARLQSQPLPETESPSQGHVELDCVAPA